MAKKDGTAAMPGHYLAGASFLSKGHGWFVLELRERNMSQFV